MLAAQGSEAVALAPVAPGNSLCRRITHTVKRSWLEPAGPSHPFPEL